MGWLVGWSLTAVLDGDFHGLKFPHIRAIPVDPQVHDRIGGGKEQIGFVAQDVQASGKLGATMCKTKNLDGRELMALDYQKLSVVLWGVVKKLQKRVERLEKKKGRKGDSD